MIRLTILSLLIGLTFIANAQRKMDNQAYARFFSEAPLEDIEAINEKALGVLDFSTGPSISFQIRSTRLT